MFVARQLANRAIELKIFMSSAFLYGEQSSTAGSASVYRTLKGVRANARDNSGVTSATGGSFSYTIANTMNTNIVNRGVFPDTLVVPTGLVASMTGFDSSNRRLLESDRIAGYTLQQVQLQQGNIVNVVVDTRVNGGDAFLWSNERLKAVPLQGRGMFVIAAVDFTDAKKRRVLGEWTLEVRNPSTFAWYSNLS